MTNDEKYAATQSIHLFLESYNISNDQGQKLDFKNHAYLWDIYKDFSPKQAILKAAQIGFSTAANIKALWLAKNKKLDIIYSLPSASDIKDFVGGKTNRLIANNPIFQEWTQDKDSIEQKRVGSNVIYFRGCVSEDTEVLTKTGWKTHDKILIGEQLPTFNLDTQEVEFDTVLDISKFIVDEPIVHIKNDAIDALVTKDHRCVVQYRWKNKPEIKRAYELTPGSNQALIQQTKGIHIPNGKYSDAFVEVLGWVIAEGSYWTQQDKSRYVKKDGTISPKSYTRDKVCIIQKNHKEDLRDTLCRAGIRFYEKKHGNNGCKSFVINEQDGNRIRSIIPEKTLTFELINSLSRHQMELMVSVLIKTDGHTKKCGFQTFIQKNKETLDAFQYLIALIGKGSTLRMRKINHYGKEEIGEISIKKSARIHKYALKEVHHKGIMWCPTTKNGTIYTRRNGKVWITGQTWTERAAIAIPADLYISDETDRSKQEIVSQYATRLQHSDYAWEWYFSNPSVPGNGVDKYWQISDQKHWFVRCDCNKGEHNGRQYLTMDNIKYSKIGMPYFGCKFCGKELNRRAGEWIRKYQDKPYSGYWISLFMNPRISAEYILTKKKEFSEEQFANFVIGQPYVGKGNVITKQMFMQNLVDRVNPQDARPIIGVDTGKGINYVVGNKYGLFYYDKCEDYGPLEALLRRWSNAIMVIDQGGDIIGPRKLREKYPNRVFLCFFRQDRKNDEIVSWNDDDGSVVADRNKMIQLVIDEFTEKRIPIYGTEADWWDVWTEFAGMYRTQEENALGIPVYNWHKPASGRCDYPFSIVYWRIGMGRFLESTASFHEPSPIPIGSQGLDVRPNNTTFLPKM